MRRGLAYAFIAAGVVLVSALPASGSVRTAPPTVSAAEQVQALELAVPRIPKLDSGLANVYETEQSQGLKAAIGTAQGLGLDTGSGTVQVVVESDDTAAAQTAIAAVGGAVAATSGNFLLTNVPPQQLVALTQHAAVDYVRPPFTPVPESPVTDEAVGSTNADLWQALGRTGTGVKVAIVDVGFAGYAAAQASGDVPAPAATPQHDCGTGANDQYNSTSHGTEVAAAVHAMAPGASLYLICIANEVDLATAETYAKANGVKIINESLGWFNTSRGDGSGQAGTPDAIAAKAANTDGILWVNAAGDQAQEHWSGTWASDTAPGASGENDFAPGDPNNVVTIPLGGKMCAYLKWDKWPKPTKANDLDFNLFLWNPAAGDFPISADSDTLQDGSAPPTEQFCFTNNTGTITPSNSTPTTSFQLKIFWTSLLDPASPQPPTPLPQFDLFVTGNVGPLQYDTPAGSVVEPASSPNAFAVGASCWQSGTVESYSSVGPTISGLVKPDLDGPDSVSNVIAGPFGPGPCGAAGFTGTSASAAHVSGAAALVQQLNPTFTPAQLRTYLTTNASPGAAGAPDNLRLPLLDPTVTGVTPAFGPIGSTVTITGTSLSGTTAVQFGDGASNAPTGVTDTQITVVVPPGALTGTIHITRGDRTADSPSPFTISPRVDSFTPTSGLIGDAVEIDGLNFTGATQVSFGATPAASFTVDDDTKIETTVPAGATTGKVTVTAPGASGASTGTFTVILPPTIASFTPTSGPTGTQITITGTNLDSADSATLAGVTAPILQHVSPTQIVVSAPALPTVSTGTGKLAVHNAAGTSLDSAGSFAVTPFVRSFTPSQGPHGGSVTITGTSFTTATKVTFNNVSATFTADSDTQLTATVPATGTTGKVAVTTATGTATSSGTFTVTPAPTITSFTPTSGAEGTVVTISGANLAFVTSATLNGLDTGLVSHSGTQLKVTIPPGATSGHFVVSNPPVTATNATVFKVTPKVDPVFSPVHGKHGTLVTITGTSFTDASKVTFNGVSTAVGAVPNFTVVDDHTITATVPSTATTGKIAVTTPSGTGTSTSSFTVDLKPTISSFTPTSAATGATVTITGTNLQYPTLVTLGGADVTGSITSATATQLKLQLPGGALGGKFQISNQADVSSLSSSSLKILPSVSSDFGPPEPGGTTGFVIHGTSFQVPFPASKVTFNGVSATFHVDNDSQITATVPANATTGKIAVTTGTGSAAATGTSTGSFTVILKPTISSLSPTSAAVGSTLTINGSNLTYVTDVSFPGALTEVITHVNSNQIKVTIPDNAATGAIVLTDAAGFATSSLFKVLPRIDGFTPDHGLRGTAGPPLVPGTPVTITGESFSGTTKVTFNGIQDTTAVAASKTEISAHVPPTATTGKIAVTTGTGTTAATGTSSGAFTVIVKPTISSISPTSGAIGSTVTITGTNLGFADTVTFAGFGPTAVVVGSATATQVKVVVPPGATNGQLVVHNPADNSLPSSTIFKVSPTVSGFLPDHGARGSSITITGLNFTGATAVKFNGVSATTKTVNSDTTLTATVPGSATTGKIAVTTPNGTGTSLTNFNVVLAPTIGSFTPTSGVAGATVTINGTNLTYADSVLFSGPGGTPVAGTGLQNVSATQLKVTVPDSAVSGKLIVHNDAGSVTSSGTFTINPTVTSYDPAGGAPADAAVTITGASFVPGHTTVTFNGVAATVGTTTATSIQTTVPATASTGPVKVTVNGTAQGTGPTFKVTPTITGFADTSGETGEQVTITGTTFVGVTSVTFNGAAVNSDELTVDSPTTIHANVPSAATTGPIAVTTAGGTATTVDSFTVLPVFTGFNLDTGVEKGPVGSTVTLSGTGFHAPLTVQFGGLTGATATTVSIPNSKTIVATVPLGATTGKIEITPEEGNGPLESDDDFTVTPTVTGFDPAGGGATGSAVTISGTSFIPGSTTVTFNGVPAVVGTTTTTSIETTVPADATTGKISVTTPDGTATTTADFDVLPTITSFTPLSAETGSSVIITGTGFDGVSSVQFNGVEAYFTDRGQPTSTSIDATVPGGATTGLISVTTPGGTVTSADPFSVQPSVDDFTPTNGPIGTTVTITGTGFHGSPIVQFGGANAMTVDVVDSKHITADVPADAVTGPITVTQSEGSSDSPSNFIVSRGFAWLPAG